MSRRSTNALARRVVLALALAVGCALVATSSGPAGGPWSSGRSGSSSVAWADTQRISDGATASVPDRVRVGGTIEINGRGWTTPGGGGGSVIAIKLDDGDVRARTSVANPATGDPVADPSVVAAVHASDAGSFTVSVPVPHDSCWTTGTRHSVRLLTGRLLSDDATRSVALTFDLVAGSGEPSPASTARSSSPASPSNTHSSATQSAAAPTPSGTAASGTSDPTSSAAGGPATPTATTSGTGPAVSTRQRSATTQKSAAARSADEGAGSADESLHASSSCASEPVVVLSAKTTVRGVPVAELGGTLGLKGTGFCHPSGAGSLIAVQIDEGRVARLDSTVDSDRTIWQIVEADARGEFFTTVRVPEAHQTDPEFADGVHRLWLRTGSLRAGDAVRTVRTAEFVVAPHDNAGVLPEPTSTPRPVDPEFALVGSKARAVTADRTGTTVRIVVPELEPGDWVFPYAFGDRAGQPEAQPTSWLQLDADRSVMLDAADLEAAGEGGTRVSLQARDGTMVGWVPVVAATGAEQTGPVPAVVDTTEPAAPPEAAPRPLVVTAAGFLLLVGMASLTIARRRRRRLIRELNG